MTVLLLPAEQAILSIVLRAKVGGDGIRGMSRGYRRVAGM
jgi:hypothetical protein